MSLDEIGKFVNAVGFPVAFCVVCFYAVWRTGRFMGPIVQRIATSHVDLVDTLKANDTAKTGVMKTQSELLAEHSEMLHDIRSAVKGKA